MYCYQCGANAGASAESCPACGTVLKESVAGQHLPGSSDARILELRAKLSDLESRLPSSRVIDPDFWPRALALFGHQMAAILAIYAVSLIVGVALVLVVALVSRLGGV
jgi:hypothetical protein